MNDSGGLVNLSSEAVENGHFEQLAFQVGTLWIQFEHFSEYFTGFFKLPRFAKYDADAEQESHTVVVVVVRESHGFYECLVYFL
jgi:hypothetical protein